eukprot:scaffold11649_cov126-Isochrysis_galbana.AAC.1
MPRIFCERRIYHAGRVYFTDCFGTTGTHTLIFVTCRNRGHHDHRRQNRERRDCCGRRRRHERLFTQRCPIIASLTRWAPRGISKGLDPRHGPTAWCVAPVSPAVRPFLPCVSPACFRLPAFTALCGCIGSCEQRLVCLVATCLGSVLVFVLWENWIPLSRQGRGAIVWGRKQQQTHVKQS